MPCRCSSAPRKKLPPPMTAATCMPLHTTAAIWRAIDWTTSGSTPTAPPPKTSPDSFSTTRRARGPPRSEYASTSAMFVVIRTSFDQLYGYGKRGPRRSWYGHRRPPPSLTCGRSGLAHLEADEPVYGHPRLVENLLDGLLLVGDRRLLQQHEVLEEGVDPALDDLRQRPLGLALLAGGLLGDAPLGLDHVGRNLVAGQVLRPHRGDLHGDATGVVGTRLVVLAGPLDGDAHLRGQVRALAVQVHGDVAVEDGEPVEHQLLADL